MPSNADLARAREIDRKFGELDLGLVDASIVALVEPLALDGVSFDTAFGGTRDSRSSWLPQNDGGREAAPSP
jgi:predicted nucleic acid-binding protein